MSPPHRGLLRSFRHPWLWLAIYAAMVGVVVGASLMPARDLPPPPFSGVDKLEHFLAYFGLSSYAVMLLERMRPQALCAAGLIALGVGLEFAQAGLTADRAGDSADALANSLGVFAGLMLSRTRAAGWLQRVDARIARRR